MNARANILILSDNLNPFNVGVLGSSPRRITRELRPSKVLALTFLSHTFTCGETCLKKNTISSAMPGGRYERHSQNEQPS